MMCCIGFRQQVVALLCVVSPLLYGAQQSVPVPPVSYVAFAVPGALGTYPMAINNSRVVTGYYFVSPATTRGFLRDAAGGITTFTVLGGVWTEPESINAAGDIAGYYEVVPGVPHGFLRYADGRVITFDPPDNPWICPKAQPVSINDFDEIVGNYPFPGPASAGFSRSREGVFTTLGFAGGADYKTVVTGLDRNGTIVGYFAGVNTLTSFYPHPDGSWAEFVVPAEQGANQIGIQATVAESINLDGYIAGWFQACYVPCTTTHVAGFVRSPQGVFTLFYPEGSIVTSPAPGLVEGGDSLSAPHRLSISTKGTITGSLVFFDGTQHGFVRDANGAITAWDPDPPHGSQTTATCINDGGVIAGSYYDDATPETALGFLRIP